MKLIHKTAKHLLECPTEKVPSTELVDLQLKIHEMTEKNSELQEEIDALRTEYNENKPEFSHSMRMITTLSQQLAREQEKGQPIPPQSLRNLQKINKKHESLLNSVSELQETAKEVMRERERNIVKSFDSLFKQSIAAENAKLEDSKRESDQRAVNRLTYELELLRSNLIYCEQANNKLIQENKSLKTQLFQGGVSNSVLSKQLSWSPSRSALDQSPSVKQSSFISTVHPVTAKSTYSGLNKEIEAALAKQLLEFGQEADPRASLASALRTLKQLYMNSFPDSL